MVKNKQYLCIKKISYDQKYTSIIRNYYRILDTQNDRTQPLQQQFFFTVFSFTDITIKITNILKWFVKVIHIEVGRLVCMYVCMYRFVDTCVRKCWICWKPPQLNGRFEWNNIQQISLYRMFWSSELHASNPQSIAILSRNRSRPMALWIEFYWFIIPNNRSIFLWYINFMGKTQSQKSIHFKS